MGIQRIRHEVAHPDPYTPKTTSGDVGTRYSETPRSLHANSAAFKGPEYAGCIQHFRAPARFGWLMWLGTVVILLAIAVMIVINRP